MAADNRAGQALGMIFTAVPSVGTSQNNAAANWVAFSFVPDAGRTLSTARVFVSAVAGTLGAGDITCDLYDSTGAAGVPGSSIETGKLPSATITAAGWYNFNGFTTALTAGQQYWLVFKNVNGTPASNNCTFRPTRGGGPVFLIGSATRQMWQFGSSTNSGSTWSTNTVTATVRVGYADGTFDGMPMSNVTAALVGDGVYSTRESGVLFTSPATAALNVAGLAMLVGAKSGTPTGSPRFGLWTGSSPVNQGYTNSLPATAITTQQWVYSYFSANVVLQPSTVTRVTLGETTQSDASTNRWNNYEISWDTDANSLALLPFQGTCVKTYFDGSSWTDTAGSIFGFALLLDTAGGFSPVPGPPSLILQPPSSY